MQKLAILYGASQAVISTFDLDEVLRRIVALVQANFAAGQVSILLLDSETNILHARAQLGWNDHSRRPGVPVGQDIVGMAAKLKRPIYSADLAHDARYQPADPGVRSEVAVPLIIRDEVLGVLDTQSEQPNFFGQESIELLTLFSAQASTAIQNARLYTMEQRKAAQLQAINEIAKETTVSLQIDELLAKVCGQVLSSFPVEHVAALLNEAGRPRLRAESGSLTLLLEGALTCAGGIFDRVLQSGKSLVNNDLAPSPEWRCFAESRSEVCAPLRAHGEVLGMLVVGAKAVHAFAPADVSALESVADICATALENSHYLQTVREMAYIDGLTGVHNRRYFDLRIAEEIERAKRYETGVSLILVDLDHFKELNDDYGHLVGDEVLRGVARLFVNNLRKADIAARYGGEEFALIVPETTGDDAVAVAEKLRQELESQKLDGVARPVTLTAGVASFPANGTDVQQLIRAADAALYAGKQAGRNRVVAASAVAVASGRS